MCFKASRQDERAKARERLAEVRVEERTPSEATRRPRDNQPADRRETERAAKRLTAVVGR